LVFWPRADQLIALAERHTFGARTLRGLHAKCSRLVGRDRKQRAANSSTNARDMAIGAVGLTGCA
jgi:hypothetical protein